MAKRDKRGRWHPTDSLGDAGREINLPGSVAAVPGPGESSGLGKRWLGRGRANMVAAKAHGLTSKIWS